MSVFQKRVGLSALFVGVAIVALVVGLNVTPTSAPSDDTLSYSMTLDPTIIANLTSVPQSTPLSGKDAEEFETLIEQVQACDDYSDERRSQMLQHIDWLINPATLSSQMLIALGTNPDAGLIFGMAGYTSTQWRLLERPADSCLIDIGRDLNLMLEATGRDPLTIYDE